MNNYYPWIYEFSRRKNLLTLGFIYIFSLVISYISLVSPESTFVRTWLNDVLALVNSAHRVFQGQFPSIDFHTLYGPLVFYFPALGFHAGLPPSTVLAFGGVLAAAILLLAATLTMYSRFSLPAAVTTLVFLWLLIVVPMGSGKGYSEITWGAYYNRHAWAAVAIIFLFYVEPKNEHLWDKWIDSFILSVLAVFAFYTKITYGLVAVGFVLANIISSKYNRKISIISIVFFIFFALLSEIC